jgi:hypothetical protein
MAHKAKRIGVAVILIAVLNVLAPTISVIPDFLPKEWTTYYAVTHEPLVYRFSPFGASAAHEPFYGSYILNSSEIPKGTDVWGNITFYYPKDVQDSIQVNLFTDENYENANFMNYHRLSIYESTNPIACCSNSTDNTIGYAFNFRFVSMDTTSYVFMFRATFAKRVVADLFKGGSAEAQWRQPARLIGAILSVSLAVYAAVTFLRKEKRQLDR